MSSNATARGLTAVALSLFQVRNPELAIKSIVDNGETTHHVLVSRNVANRALRRGGRYNACECAVAIPASEQIPGALDVFVNKTGACVLFVAEDGEGQAVKFDHSGSGVVEAIGSGERMTVDALVTFRPPAASRRVGAQSQEQKNNPVGGRRGPQSAEHVARRVASNRGSLRRIEEAALFVSTSA